MKRIVFLIALKLFTIVMFTVSYFILIVVIIIRNPKVFAATLIMMGASMTDSLNKFKILDKNGKDREQRAG